MVLIACSECGKEVSDKATSCPHCGAPVVRVVVRGRAFIIDEQAPKQAPKIDPSSATVFRHPKSGQQTDIDRAWLWTLLFGVIYFAIKGVWTHAIASLLLAFGTAGISWLIYPVFAKKIVRNHLLVKGWQPVS